MKEVNKSKCEIVNLNLLDTNDTHWVKKKNCNVKFYFDSYLKITDRSTK